MPITSKEAVIILLGIVGSGLLALLSKYFNIENMKIEDYILIIATTIIAVAAGIIIIYKMFGEVNKELEEIKSEQKQLNEKLIIYDRLAKLEKRYSNGKK